MSADERNTDRMKKEAMRLLMGFQCAILELPIAMQRIESPDDKERANYVLGMCVINSGNCEALLNLPDENLSQRMGELAKFLYEAGRFLTSLQEHGFGQPNKE